MVIRQTSLSRADDCCARTGSSDCCQSATAARRGSITSFASLRDSDDERLVRAAANAPVTAASAQRGKAELAKMRRSLVAWLSFRMKNDQVAAGSGVVKPPVMLSPAQKKNRVVHTPKTLRQFRAGHEQDLATQLYQLLGEVFDPQSLPDPDLAKNPSAAVQLAKIAIAGKLPGEAPGPAAQGAMWVWPVVIVVGAIAFVVMTAINSSADVAKQKEQIECIKAGACTDTGFFLKVAAVGLIAWFAWDKLGLREKVKGVASHA